MDIKDKCPNLMGEVSVFEEDAGESNRDKSRTLIFVLSGGAM